MNKLKPYALLINLFLVHSYVYCQEINSIGMKMIDIPAGEFEMGSARGGEDADESPVHKVIISRSFKMSAIEITNRQYEEFDSAHRQLRGKNGFSTEDDEAVIFVSYHDAVAFCNWLTEKEGKTYRLPTEAEWEYACRARTSTDFHTGDQLPEVYHKSQETRREPVHVSLKVGQSPPNNWGLYDMHGNVEEWCHDWYGPYSDARQADPLGYDDGLFRVTRGGSHNTPVQYLRSANRMGMLPEDKHWLTGFRVVQAEWPVAKPSAANPLLKTSENISQKKYRWKKSAAKKAVFDAPVPYVVPPGSGSNIPFYKHNHQPAITWCDNGDLLATWFSTNAEHGREMTVLSSRLKPGKDIWEQPVEFFKVPDRNMTGTSLFHDKKGKIYHMNGIEAAGDWQNLAMVLRYSEDNGASWSRPQLVAAEHKMRHQVIAGTLKTKEGWLIQPCDAVPGPKGGTAIYISRDEGKTWINPAEGAEIPDYQEGATGGLVAGIHAGVLQLKGGSLLALGRNDDIPDQNGIPRMPMSISRDMGKTWTYYTSEFPPINSGQRLVLIRLNEGPILLISFTHCPGKVDKEFEGMDFTDENGNLFRGYGMYAALSYDEGKTWPVKKLLSDGKTRTLNGGAWTGEFTMDATHAEPKGYLAITQTPDNMIHLLSSSLHYVFNLKWVEQPNVAGD